MNFRFVLLVGVSALATSAAAQPAPVPDEAPAAKNAEAATPAPAEPLPGAHTEEADTSEEPVDIPEAPHGEIIVTATRSAYSIASDLKPEAVLTSEDVASLGVGSLNELMAELAPETTSVRGGRPVVLLNGRRVSSFDEIREIPTEAVAGVEVMPEQTALRFGYPADQKVVNIILHDHVRTLSATLGGSAPTDGGQTDFNVQSSLLQLDHNGRVNITLSYDRSSALLESARNVRQDTPPLPYAIDGNITGAPPGTPIAGLTGPGGAPLTTAGVLPGAILGTPTLSSFSPDPNVSDTGRWRTLQPQTETVTLNAVFSRNLSPATSATLTADLSYNSSKSLQGLAPMSLTVPAGSPFSPIPSDIILHRYLDEAGPLGQRNWSFTGNFGGTLNGRIDSWMWTATATYDITSSHTNSVRGYDLADLQAAILGGTPGLNPFAAVSDAYLADPLRDRARSTDKSADVALLASGSPFSLPAGEVMTSLSLEGQFNTISARSNRSGVDSASDLKRNTAAGQANISLPITSRREDFLGAIGDISANLDIAYRHHSDFGTLHTFTWGLDWMPVKSIDILFSHTDEGTAPTMQQLGDPLVVTTGVRMFDYVRGETVDIDSTTGGNPFLSESRAHTFNLGATIQPFPQDNLRFTINYLRRKTDSPTAVFPAATAAIEAAFPDRFTRDSAGRLLALDARPINFFAQREQELRWGINLSKDFSGKQDATQPRGGPGIGRPQGNPGQGRAAQGARSGGPGMRGGPFGRRPGVRMRATLYHTIHLQNQLDIRAGGPTLDLLHGDTIGAAGGQPRHEVEAGLNLFANGIGGRLDANWQSGTTVRDTGGSAGDLHFSSLTTFNLRLFANLGDREKLTAAVPFFRNARLSVEVTNIFNRRMDVRDADGNTPVRFQPAYMDALGRTVSLTFRKMLGSSIGKSTAED